MDMYELEEALEIMFKNVNPILDTIKIDTIDSTNRVLSDCILSPICSPPFNKSPYDGYAYDANKFKEKLKVVGTIYAGDSFDIEVVSGEAVKIMTGAKLPQGTNCVIKKEDVNLKKDYIILNKKVKEFENFIAIGEDIKEGELILNKNHEVSFEDVGVLSSVGICEVDVYRDLKVGFISTGSELQDIGTKLKDAKIYDSNKYIIYARLKRLGIKPLMLDREIDDLGLLTDKIEKSIDDVDILVTTGGVSVGDKDLTPKVFKDLGAKVLFDRVNIKPGGTCCVATLGEKILFGLSGNPHAASVAFDSMFVPLFKYMSNKKRDENIKAVFRGSYDRVSGMDRFVRGRMYVDGTNVCVKLTDHKNAKAKLSASLNSNCLIRIKSGEILIDNQVVDVIRF
jgi:molybdopterin molybdotransferase